MFDSTSDSCSSTNDNLKVRYTNFELISKASYYQVFQAKSRSIQEMHSVNILDPPCDLLSRGFNILVTLFFQELVHLCQSSGGSGDILIRNI